MTVLIDEPRWQFNGRLWAHLVSDATYQELHDFAEAAGMRFLGVRAHGKVDAILAHGEHP